MSGTRPSSLQQAMPLAGALAIAVLLAVTLAGCRPGLAPGKPISQLSPLETDGYAVYQEQCARCHNAYDAHAHHGPSLLGIFRKPYLPSGAPANDERVSSVILHGRDMMPPFSNAVDQEQLQALLAYLHTL